MKFHLKADLGDGRLHTLEGSTDEQLGQAEEFIRNWRLYPQMRFEWTAPNGGFVGVYGDVVSAQLTVDR